MPLGASRISFLAKSQVTVVAEVIRRKVGTYGTGSISTAQSQFGGASYFVDDATSQYLATADNSAATNFGTDDFTVEFWVYRTEDFEFDILADHRDTATDNAVAIVYSSASNYLYLYINGAQRTTSSSDIPVNTWTHIAVVRSSGTIELYINGTSEGTPYSNSNDFTTSNGWYFGKSRTAGTSPSTAYYDEIRVSNTARYTAGFTPSTTPFVNDDNTLLLLHCDGSDGSITVEDDNGDGRSPVGVSANGNAQIDTAQSQFGGSSGLFDGASDYLQPGDLDILASDDVTIEFWIRFNTFNSVWDMVGASNTNNYFGIRHYSGTVKAFGAAWQGSSGVYYRNMQLDSVPSTGTWYHFALVKNGTNLYYFWDGVEQTTVYATSGTMTSDKGFANLNSIADWTNHASGYAVDAHIDEFRVSKTARYTTNFTPDTTPFVNDADTVLLLHMDGTDGEIDFFDDNGLGRARVGVSAVNQAQVDTAQSQYGGASLLLDGTGDYLKTAFLDAMAFGTNDFTMEAWIRTTTTASQVIISGRYGTGGTVAENNNVLAIVNGKLSWSDGSAWQIQDSVDISTNTWVHTSVVRSSGTVTVYKDGVSVGSHSYTTSINGARPIYVGAFNTGTVNFNGHIDEVRISTTARYTTSFTPDTTTFVNDANTLLLLHMDGSDGQTTFLDDNGVY